MIARDDMRRAVEAAALAELPELIGAFSEMIAVAQRRLMTEPTPTSSTTDELIDARTMAAQLSIKSSWLLEMARQGRVPCVRLGKYVRFRPVDVLAWSESQTHRVCDRS